MRADERGFTLIEIIVAFAVFAIVIVGTLTVVGGAYTGGFLETFPTAFSGGRVAKDYTAASVYLQAFHEHLAGLGSAAIVLSGNCTVTLPGEESRFATLFQDYPSPPAPAFQLDWTKLEVQFERWNFDDADVDPNKWKYVGLGACTVPAEGDDALMRVVSTLTWKFKDATRQVQVDRFIPRTPGGSED